VAKETKLQIVIDAQNNTASGFAALKKQLDITQVSVAGVSDAMKSVGKVGAVAFAGLTAFVGSSVKSYGDAQLAIAKVDATLRAMGKSSDGTKEKILQASQAVVRLGFDDEAAAVSITKLYQRTGDLNKAIELNALAMDLSRAKSVDLSTASQMISLVMSGNARALKEYGIVLDDTKTPMEAISELQKMVAGQAETATESITVQGQVLRETFSNLQDTIGKQFVPVLTQAVQAIVPVIEKIGAWIEKNPELAKNIMIATLVITGLMAVLLPLGIALPGIVIGFNALGVVFAAVTAMSAPLVLAIGAVVAILGVLVANGYTTKEAWSMVWLGIKTIAAESANAVIDTVEGMVNFIIKGVNKAIDAINKVIKLAQKVPGLGDKVSTIRSIQSVDFGNIDTNAMAQSTIPKPTTASASSPLSVYVTGNSFLDQYGAEQIGDLIMKKLKTSNAL